MGDDHTAQYSFGMLLLLCSPQAHCHFTWRSSLLGHTARYSLPGLPLLLCAARGCVFLAGHTARYSFGVLLLLCPPKVHSAGTLVCIALALLLVTRHTCVADCMPPRHTRLIPDRHVPVARHAPPLDEGPALIRPTSSVSDKNAAQSSLASSATSVSMATSTTTASPLSAPVAPSTMAAWIPPRGDGQGTEVYTRGSKRLAVHIASDPAARDMANQELKDRIFSKSNKHTVATKLDTWADVAAAAGFNDPYSLDVDMVYHIAACLWKAGYRSLDSYLAVARQEMIIKHDCIPDSLALHFKRISRAASRGCGPAQQATEFPFLQLADLGDSEVPLAPSGPRYPGRFATIASWWMLREIEASNLTLDCVSFEDKVAHLRLPTSRVDHTGKGTTRSLCCTCSSLSSLLCPFHILET